MRTTRALLLSLSLLLPQGLLAGAAVMAEFKDQRAQTPEVLSHVPLKAVVAEFLDPLDSGLGKSLGYLIWREVLTAISDQAGAGVIIAEAPPGERLVDMLQQNYHEAAERIGRHQRARMVIWGAVEEDGEELLVETYLSNLAVGDESGLRLSLFSKVIAGPRNLQETEPGIAIEADLSHKRYNFATEILSRKALFERVLVTNARVRVHRAPNKQSEVVLHLPANRTLQAVDMTGAWFKVKLPQGGEGYVHAGSFGNLRLPPREVSANLNSVNLRAGPGTDHRRVRTQPLKGHFRVLNMRYRQGKGLWYRIDTGEQETWIAGWLVKPRFSLAAVHYIAGLYRYYGGRHEQAIGEFEQFIRHADPVDDNVNLAAAHQMLGASRLLRGDGARGGYQAFSKAIELTPYNPNAYLLRSLVSLSAARPQDALKDLSAALKLDANFKPARNTVASSEAIARQSGFSRMERVTHLSSQKRQLKKLLKRYQIKPLPMPP